MILRYSSTKLTREFLKFWFFAILLGGSAAQSPKNVIFSDFGCRKIGKNRNIKISRVNFLRIPTRIMHANFWVNRTILPETSFNFSVKKWYFLSAKNAILFIRDFPQQRKPYLTYSFITFEPSVSRSSMSTFWKLERQLYDI